MSQPCTSLPVAAMNCWNSSTVTGVADMLSGREMTTQCIGISNGAAFSARGAPCLNRPVGNTTMLGQVGQSRMIVPGAGIAAGALTGACGSGVCRPKNQAAIANSANPNPAIRERVPERGFQPWLRLAGAGSSASGLVSTSDTDGINSGAGTGSRGAGDGSRGAGNGSRGAGKGSRGAGVLAVRIP